MAQKAAQDKKETHAAAPPPQKPTLFIILAAVNMFVVLGVGLMLYMSNKAAESEPGVDDVIKGEAEAQKRDEESEDFIGKVIPLETFLVNLSQSRGRRLAKVNMEFEVDSDAVQAEIDKLKPKIRDMIIVILSSKSYEQISGRDGKNQLRDEIRDQVNLFLTKGQIKRVFFTEFIYN